jgi:hypothetical protein
MGIPNIQPKWKFVMPAHAGIQVTESVRHTVGKRYPGDDKAGMTALEVDFQLTLWKPLSLPLRPV